MDQVERTSSRKYILSCLMCKGSLVGVNHAVSFCSDVCRERHGIKKKEGARKAAALKSNPFHCKKCGVGLYRRKSKAFKKGLCSKKCDGIPKDKGGYPLASNLRSQHVQKKIVRKTKKIQKHSNATSVSIITSVSFFESREWLELRYQAIKLNGRKCQACFARNVEIHVDHIKPRSKYPELALELSNLQVLCKSCNLGKSNIDETDWREPKKSKSEIGLPEF